MKHEFHVWEPQKYSFSFGGAKRRREKMGLGMQNTWICLENQVSGSQEDSAKSTE